MTSPTEAAVIASRSLLARSELQAGLVAPDKANDDAGELLLATASRLVTAAPEGEVMS